MASPAPTLQDTEAQPHVDIQSPTAPTKRALSWQGRERDREARAQLEGRDSRSSLLRETGQREQDNDSAKIGPACYRANLQHFFRAIATGLGDGLCGGAARGDTPQRPLRPSFPIGLARCEPRTESFVNALLLLLAACLCSSRRWAGRRLVDEAILLPVTRSGYNLCTRGCDPACRVALIGLAGPRLILGLALFRDHYTGGGGRCAHAHGDDDASCGDGGDGGDGDGGGGGGDNMRGVFLHVLADTMSSVGSVVSWVLLATISGAAGRTHSARSSSRSSSSPRACRCCAAMSR